MTPDEIKLRDEIALKILVVQLRDVDYNFAPDCPDDYDDWASDAYEFADAMMRARKKGLA